MPQYNPNIHHRRSIRLKGYDYATAGLYFVTICTQNRAMMFGRINNGEMVLNDAGRMVEQWYAKTAEKFPDIVCHEMIVMPNHFHCIWQNVGADPCVRPNTDPCVRPNMDPCVRPENGIVRPNMDPCVRPNTDQCVRPNGDLGAHVDLGAHRGAPLPTGTQLSTVVQWFKTMTTNEYIRGVKQLDWPPFDRKLWQRNYFEHIIRNEFSYDKIANYIITNPSRWKEDKFYLI